MSSIDQESQDNIAAAKLLIKYENDRLKQNIKEEQMDITEEEMNELGSKAMELVPRLASYGPLSKAYALTIRSYFYALRDDFPYVADLTSFMAEVKAVNELIPFPSYQSGVYVAGDYDLSACHQLSIALEIFTVDLYDNSSLKNCELTDLEKSLLLCGDDVREKTRLIVESLKTQSTSAAGSTAVPSRSSALSDAAPTTPPPLQQNSSHSTFKSLPKKAKEITSCQPLVSMKSNNEKEDGRIATIHSFDRITMRLSFGKGNDLLLKEGKGFTFHTNKRYDFNHFDAEILPMLSEKKRIARMARGAYSGTDTGGLCDYLEDEGYRVRIVDTDDFPNGLILAVRPKKIPRIIKLKEEKLDSAAAIADSSKSDVGNVNNSSSKKETSYSTSYTASAASSDKYKYLFKPSADILVIFRGSNGLDLRDWYYNLQAWNTGKIETDYIKLYHLHAGFASRAALLLPQITKILDGFLQDIRLSNEEIEAEDHFNISLTCIGHSQGASLASLMGLILDRYYRKGEGISGGRSAEGDLCEEKKGCIPKKAADHSYHLYKATKVHAFAFPGLFKKEEENYFSHKAFVRQINYSIINDPIPIASSLVGYLQSGTTNNYYEAYLPESLQDSIAAPHGPKVYNNVIQDIANACDFSSYLLRLRSTVRKEEDWKEKKTLFVRRLSFAGLKVILFAVFGVGLCHWIKNEGFSKWIHGKLLTLFGNDDFSLSHLFSFFKRLV
jgi:hypothetical protein